MSGKRFLPTIVRVFLIFVVLDLLLSSVYHSIQSQSNFYNASALSVPTYERQEINDLESRAWIFWPWNNEKVTIVSKDGSPITVPTAQNESECLYNKSISPEISSASYMSDEESLASTIWTSAKLLQDRVLKNNIDYENLDSNSTTPLWHKLKFTMAIDVDSTFDEGIDYRIDLSNEMVNSSHNEWRREIYEISSEGANKLISNQSYDEFPYLEEEFVDFNVNLKSISNPQKYRALFYITDLYIKDGRFCRMVDSTNWVFSPPPQFNIIISPNSIFMRPGDERDIIVTISGNTDVQSRGRFYVNHTNNDNHNLANVNFLSNDTAISSFSNGTSILRIDVPSLELNRSKHLVIPIAASITFPTNITNRDGETFSNNKSISLLERSNVVLTILPSLTLPERLEGIAKTLKPIGDLWQIFAAIGTVIVSATLYLYKKRTSKNQTDEGKANVG